MRATNTEAGNKTSADANDVLCMHQLRCGQEAPDNKCSSCGFAPPSDEDKAKSLILSLDYEIDNEYRGTTIEELKEIAAKLQSGSAYEFDPSEIRAIRDYAQRVGAVPPSKLILDGLKWLLPPILLLLAALLFLTR